MTTLLVAIAGIAAIWFLVRAARSGRRPAPVRTSRTVRELDLIEYDPLPIVAATPATAADFQRAIDTRPVSPMLSVRNPTGDRHEHPHETASPRVPGAPRDGAQAATVD